MARGAIGGVVNVILRRDYRGADLFLTSGISDRGDAGRMRLEGRIGFTPDGGTTDVMLYGAFSFSQRLRYDQRDYDERSRRLRFANDPAGYVAPYGSRSNLPLSNAILVTSANGSPLSLDPAFGGTSLGASFTYLPLDFVGTDADRRAALVANAGKIDLAPPTDLSGRRRSLVNRPDVISGLLNIRRRFGDGIEAFVDGIYFRNRGRTRYATAAPNATTLADAPNNPFAQRVIYRYPSGLETEITSDSELLRLVGGLITDLPGGWRASAEFAFGSARYDASDVSSLANNGVYSAAIATGLPASDGKPALFPLGDWPDFQSARATYFSPTSNRITIPNRFIDATVRLGGPVVALPGGDLSINLLGELRRERIPDVDINFTLPGAGAIALFIQQRTQKVRSAYAEVRAPLVAMDSGLLPLRGLELQLAARYDGPSRPHPGEREFTRSGAARNAARLGRSQCLGIHCRRQGLSIAYADAARQLCDRPPAADPCPAPGIPECFPPSLHPLADPRRGGRPVASEGPIEAITAGSNDILQEVGRTLSIGAVLNPEARGGPRLSIDYSRIATSREPLPLGLTAVNLVRMEDLYADRVIRAPLTDEDRALGFTAGRIVRFDLRSGNFGRRIVETVDIQFDWRLRDILGGELAPYAQATWLPSLRTRSAPGQPWIERSGYIDGPVSWRVNGGATWTRGRSAIDLNLQYFDSYRVTLFDPAAADQNAHTIRFQGRERLPAQVYVDLAGRHRFDMSGLLRSIEVRLGILNLFDRSPPILADPNSIGYSAYGDPRRRRFELVVASKF